MQEARRPLVVTPVGRGEQPERSKVAARGGGFRC
jgi:hypothetical protein